MRQLPPPPERPAPEPVAIWTELKDVITLATLSASQMKTAPRGMGGLSVLGFDRPALDVTAKWLGIRIDGRMARDIATLEAEIARVIEGRAS
jgi:hypothetical protein